LELFDNQIIEEKNKNKKMARNIIIAMVIVLVISIVIIGIIIYLQSLSLKIYVDGSTKSFKEDTFIIEESGKIYVSIKDMCETFGYEYKNGEYKTTSEDKTKCYIEGKNEIVAFEANSKKIYKIETSSKAEYEYFYMDEPVEYKNGKLYITADGIKTAFNAKFDYDKEKNRITIFTLPYLVGFYTQQIASYGYKEISDNFNNEKAIISDMIIAKKESGKYGVITTNGTEIIGAKYDEIKYVETTKNFFVTSSSKVGLIDNSGKTIIGLLYDKIELLDKDLNLYLAENSGKKGVLNKNGDILIYLEYDKIGIDSSLYRSTNIKNQYLLFDNCIPVQKNNKWGIFDKNGKVILPIEYDNIGCVAGTSNDTSANNVVIIPDYEAIVISKDKKYGIINSIGKELIPCALDTVYTVTNSGITTYQMEYSGQKLNVEKYFEAHGIQKAITETEYNTSNEDDVNISNNYNNTVDNTYNQTNNTINQ